MPSPSPIAACIQIGGNDLASFEVITPPMVFRDIRDLVLLLIDTYNIRQVTVMELLHRNATRKHQGDVPLGMYNKTRG